MMAHHNGKPQIAKMNYVDQMIEICHVLGVKPINFGKPVTA